VEFVDDVSVYINETPMNSKRTAQLKDSLLNITPEICPERAKIFTESMKESRGLPIVLRRAMGFADVLQNMSIYVREGDLLVGNQARSPRAAPVFPEYSVEWIENELNGDPYDFEDRPNDVFTYTDQTEETLKEVIEYWKGDTVYKTVRNLLPEEANKAWDIGAIDEGWVSQGGFGNVLPDYEVLLREGLQGRIDKAQSAMEELDPTEPGVAKKRWFLKAVTETNRAVIDFANRFAGKLARMAEEENNPERKNELETMAHNCGRVPEKPAETFWEALQSVWFIHLAIQIESNGHAISLGRFDQYLYPFYKKDLETGRLTRDEALELVETFFVKANEVNKLRPWSGAKFFPGYHMAENLAIGGQTENGEDAVNELTQVILDATENMGLPKPSVSLKWFEGTPDDFMERALEVVQEHSGGMPAFYNDKGVTRMLDNMGVKREDLYNWAPVGCIEASIPGKWDFAAKGPWLNVAKILEMTLYGGTDPDTGITLHKTEKELGNFDNPKEILEAFKEQLQYYMELQVETEHINDEVHKRHDKNAFRSSLIEDSIGRGKSLIEGGSIYSADGGPTVGSMTAGDSIAGIETVVFDENRLTQKEVRHALETNFEDESTSPGGEEIKQLLWNKGPKFGNDNEKADKWTVEIVDFLGSTYQNEFKSSRYGKGPIPSTYALSQSSVTGNVAFGNYVGATPDGRESEKPLNNGVSPSTGAERNGIVATINSISKLPSIWFQKGAIFNARLTPAHLKSEDGKNRVNGLVKTLFKNNQYHIQFNVVGSETLREAQKHPEKYQDLMVRVAGYSAYFTPLSQELQEDIIERVEFEEMFV